MDSQTKTGLIQLLVVAAIILIIVVFAVIGFLVYLYYKEKHPKKEKNTEGVMPKSEGNTLPSDRQSIFNFMEFDNVEDNMILQKNGNRFLMVINCQGINYDLMSGMEKNSVEAGFVQFLNTLRYPIQIYVQTRSINLESSLQGYREKVKEIENKLRNMQLQFEQMRDSGDYTEQELQKSYFELTKQANLYEYGESVIQDTERMSLNKNILDQNYYIIVSYHAAEAGNDKLDREEIKSIAFSELYTRCQSIISAISTCGVKGKILKTNELVELLYMAYNRDEAETFGLDKAIKAGYNELYSTAPDIYEKKMKELDKLIEEKAIKKAQQKVDEAKSEIQQRIQEKEENMNDIVDEIARMILEENEPYIGSDVKDLALEKLEQETKEGGKENGKKTTRRTKKSTTV